jgi:hypothetical protein
VRELTLMKLPVVVSLGCAFLLANTAQAVGPPALETQIQLSIIEDYGTGPARESYSYSALTDPAVAGRTTFSRNHPMTVGTVFGDLLNGGATVRALSGSASAESYAGVQEPSVDGTGWAR